jgi:ATP-binding cassette subfamily B protein
MLKKILHLSDQGARTIKEASLWLTLFNLATLLPVILLALIADEMITNYFDGGRSSIPLWGYWGIALVILAVMFLTYKVAYHKEYLTSGEEDMRLRMVLADKIRKLPLSYLGKRNLSDLTSIIMDDVTTLAHILSQTATELISGFLTGIVAVVILAFYDWQLDISLAACLPIVAGVMALSKLISERTNKKNKRRKLEVSDSLQEYLENIKVLRTAEKMRDYQRQLAGKIKRVIPGLILYELLAGLTIAISYNVMRIGLGFVIIVGSTMLIAGEISLVKFLLFLFVAVRVYEPLTSACENLGELISALVSTGRIHDLLAYPEQAGQEDVKPQKFDISFDHVSFGYNEEDVLHDVSFTAKQGEITALVGPSGCGKSTLCKLAARFWDVQRGTVSIGGMDINGIAPETLLKNYSIVFQDVVLFNDTIYNNIKIGKEDATREEIIAAAKLARCDEFIQRLPQGYDTVIGENGKTLSGGERQRLSIARAFLKDAPIILLDESTASIDPENETKIQEAIGKLTQNKTVLIIAHKLRSIVECDKIVVLQEGRLVEAGTHDALMEQPGLYHKLYSLQNESLEWTVTTQSE